MSETLPTNTKDSPTPSSSSSSTSKPSIKERFQALIDAPGSTNLISIYACFLTGLTSSPSFTACYIWCGFQTGNVAQLGLAIARTFSPIGERTYGFQKADQQALTSLLSFWLGTSLGRLGDKIGARRRTWLVLASFIQALLAMAASLAAHYSGQNGIANHRGDPSWTNASGMAALAFISATMGIQGIVGKRVASPMNTTVVLTTTWVEIFNDPLLFSFKYTPSRDIRIAGGFAVFVGAFVSRAILDGGGQAAALGALAGFRMIQVIWWFFIPDKPVKVDKP
ncbi:uncharacterized protein I206_101236 [Kwoniella pini CBS 10737]|uniref:Uncharacterized protein n=1 Tax=Kwoniella pini CBS 10737 TaxID=1296096 RepID=A0A1B9IBJ5_9TREE|nr:uncharacterized protein I206_00087 [Kwoniella pini CBS 10737]OCF52791.1 hypothetical protein I206_00087 [Kwoniella pini CBS 10737]